MNTERDLDRLIDDAARQMVQHEPSDGLTSAVMERISARVPVFAPSRVIWGSAAAAAAIAAVVMLISVNRTVPAAKAPRQTQGSRLTAQGSGFNAQGSGLKAQGAVQGSGLKARETGLTAQGSGLRAREAVPVPDEIAQINDPIVFEAISPEPIEVERLEVILMSVDPIEIAPIEIEPISASND